MGFGAVGEDGDCEEEEVRGVSGVVGGRCNEEGWMCVSDLVKSLAPLLAGNIGEGSMGWSFWD